jgi:hypothetical protein
MYYDRCPLCHGPIAMVRDEKGPYFAFCYDCEWIAEYLTPLSVGPGVLQIGSATKKSASSSPFNSRAGSLQLSSTLYYK